jgi:hypothetical protein
MSKQTVNERIKFIYENLFNENKTELGKAGGGSYQNVRGYLLGKNEPSVEFFTTLYLSIADKINVQWYLTGLGDPLNTTSNLVLEGNMEYESRKNLQSIIAEKERLINSQNEIITMLKKQLGE